MSRTIPQGYGGHIVHGASWDDVTGQWVDDRPEDITPAGWDRQCPDCQLKRLYHCDPERFRQTVGVPQEEFWASLPPSLTRFVADLYVLDVEDSLLSCIRRGTMAEPERREATH